LEWDAPVVAAGLAAGIVLAAKATITVGRIDAAFDLTGEVASGRRRARTVAAPVRLTRAVGDSPYQFWSKQGA
jgi:hypothetical protein